MNTIIGMVKIKLLVANLIKQLPLTILTEVTDSCLRNVLHSIQENETIVIECARASSRPS